MFQECKSVLECIVTLSLDCHLPSIAHKTLSQQLKELESSELIHRKQYNQVPPKVKYSLTDKGKTLIPILELMSQWENKYWLR